MAYDDDLADRVRTQVGDRSSLREQPMFGGLSFLIAGNMALAVSGRGGILVRVGPNDAEHLIDSTEAEAAVMGSRRMRGWVWVAPDHLDAEPRLATWVRRGVEYAESLPAKGQGKRRVTHG